MKCKIFSDGNDNDDNKTHKHICGSMEFRRKGDGYIGGGRDRDMNKRKMQHQARKICAFKCSGADTRENNNERSKKGNS